MSEPLEDWLNQAITSQLNSEADAIDGAAEEALQTGTCGVLLIRIPSSTRTEADAIVISSGFRVGLHPAVPYGHIYEIPEEGYAAFMERWIASISPRHAAPIRVTGLSFPTV